MENIEDTIAYEMAMLVKENRELRTNLEKLNRNNTDLHRKCDYLREVIHKMKEKANGKKEKPAYQLYDVPHNLKKGCHVVITESCAKAAKFPKGFVLQVNTISKNEKDIVTIHGEYQQLSKGLRYRYDSIINNKFYKWEVTEADLSIISEPDEMNNIEYIGIVEQ